jgi:hypothetical protein
MVPASLYICECLSDLAEAAVSVLSVLELSRGDVRRHGFVEILLVSGKEDEKERRDCCSASTDLSFKRVALKPCIMMFLA